MQINPFGFPMGAGLGGTPSAGAAQSGFADALGLALGTGTPASQQQPTMALGTQAPAAFGAVLAPLTDAQPQQPVTTIVPDAPKLPGLQTPTPLSQLMTTASRLPADQPVPDAPAAGAPVLEAATPALTPPVEGPAQPAPVSTAVPADTPLPEQPAPAVAPAEPKADKPVNKDEPADAPERRAGEAKAEVQLAALIAQAPAQPQVQQPTARAAVRSDGAHAQPSAKKTAGTPIASAQPSQPATSAQPGDASGFARALDAKGDAGTNTGSDTPNHDAPAPEVKLAGTARHEGGPAFPQPVQAPAATGSATPAAASAEPQIAARAGHLGQALGVEVARKVEAGEETLRVRLSPEHLGRVEVTLAFDDGKLQATVRAESNAALDLLRQDAGDLARTLDQAGIRTDAQSFRFEARDGGNGQASAQQQGQQQQRGGQHRQHAANDDLEPAPAYRAVRGDGQVDLLA